MSSLDDIKAHLHREAHELRQGQTETRQALQLLNTIYILMLLNTAGDRYRTAYEDNRACNDLVNLISPAFDELMRDNHASHEDMDRVYALRVGKSSMYLKEQNARLKRNLAAALGGRSGETRKKQPEFAASNKPDDTPCTKKLKSGAFTFW